MTRKKCDQEPASSSEEKSPSPRQCRNYARKAMAKSMPKIVNTFIGRAEDGSVAHFNQLAKFGGFDHRPAPEPVKAPATSLARRLLDDMKEHEARMIAARDARNNA